MTFSVGCSGVWLVASRMPVSTNELVMPASGANGPRSRSAPRWAHADQQQADGEASVDERKARRTQLMLKPWGQALRDQLEVHDSAHAQTATASVTAFAAAGRLRASRSAWYGPPHSNDDLQWMARPTPVTCSPPAVPR